MAETPVQLNWESSPSGLPLFKRIAESIITEILRGRLRKGVRLPSSRALAESLGVHRNTVLSAFDELIAQGYLETRPARGTFVADDLPERVSSDSHDKNQRQPVALRLARAPEGRRPEAWADSTLPLLGGLPDLRQLPLATFARAYRAALKSSPQTLDYQSVYGQSRFLRVFSKYLADTRGVVSGTGEMLLTRGSQQALFLAGRALATPGSVIAVEHAGYEPAWQAFRLAGAEVAPIRTDRFGLVVDDLARLCEQRDVVGVYVTPHHQYPTTVTMSAGRRMQLLALAVKERFVVIEDDYDHEFHFESQPVLPLASADPERVVLHVGTLSKVLAPGLRLGYAVGQSALIEVMAQNRLYIDRQGDHVTELALAYLIEDGELQAHIRRMHRSYRQRREGLRDAVEKYLEGELSFQAPRGGLALWCKVTAPLSATLWSERARERGVLVQPGKLFFFDKRDRPYLRLGYARLREDEIETAILRLAGALPRRKASPTAKRSRALGQATEDACSPEGGAMLSLGPSSTSSVSPDSASGVSLKR